MRQLSELLKFSIDNNFKESKNIASLCIKYAHDDGDLIILAKSILNESLIIDLYELESLVNPGKFDFSTKNNIGEITIEKNE